MKKFIKFIFNFIAVIVVILAIIVIFFALSTDKNGVTNIKGYIPIKMQNDLMEPTLMDNDLIFDKTIEDINTLKVNDVITFFAEENKEKVIKTERITEINTTGDSPLFMTKGDNESEQSISKVYTSDIIGVFLNKRMPYVGGILSFTQTQEGFLLCIILPLALLFIYQLFKFIQAIMKDKKETLAEEENESEDDFFKNKNEKEKVKIEQPIINNNEELIAPSIIEDEKTDIPVINESEKIAAPVVNDEEKEEIEIL